MATIDGNNYSNYNNYGAGYTADTSSVSSTRKTEATEAPQGTSGNVDQGSLSGATPAGELAYDSASLSGIDWNAVTSDMALAPNLTVSTTAIMTLLVEVMSQMRQDQREAALLDAQNALEAGLAGAEKMKDAAVMALAGSITTAAIGMGSAGMSIGSAASEMKSLNSLETRAAVNDPNSPTFDASASRVNVDLETRNIAAEGTIFQGMSQMSNQAGSMIGAAFNYQAQVDQSEAKALEAQAGYEQSIQQSDQAAFQQYGDAIKTLIQTMNSVDSATHHSMEAIYNA